MKILIILLLVIVFFTTIEISYSQLVSPKHVQDVPQVLLQLQLRNSDGQLVAYVEATKILRINSDLLNEYLDTLPSKKAITIDGKNYELFQFQRRTETFVKTHSMALFDLKVLPIDGTSRTALTMNHDAYQVEAGDKISVFWTVIRNSNLS